MTSKEKKQHRIEPFSKEAEIAVLGCILIDSESANKAMQLLKANDFHLENHQLIYNGLIELYNDNKNIDYVSITEQLKKNKSLDRIGGAYYITGLTNSAPSSQNIEYYANIVKEKSILRNVIKVARNMSEEAYDNKDELTHILDKAEQTLFSLSQDSEKKTIPQYRTNFT